MSKRNQVKWRNAILLVFGLGLTIGLSPACALEYATADEVRRMQMEGDNNLVIIDVRMPHAFEKRHIEGAINIPYNTMNNADLPKDKLLVLYCSGTTCPLSLDAAKLLLLKGYENVRVLAGGLEAWAKKGYPMVSDPPKNFSRKAQRISRISAKRLLLELGKEEIVILDLRPAFEFKAGHLPSAINMPLEKLSAALEDLPKDKHLVVYDRISKRSRRGARELKNAGFDVSELLGGITVWVARGYPLEVGKEPKGD